MIRVNIFSHHNNASTYQIAEKVGRLLNGKNRQKFWESSDDENWKGNYQSQTESGKNDETGKEVKIRFPVF